MLALFTNVKLKHFKIVFPFLKFTNIPNLKNVYEKEIQYHIKSTPVKEERTFQKDLIRPYVPGIKQNGIKIGDEFKQVSNRRNVNAKPDQIPIPRNTF